MTISIALERQPARVAAGEGGIDAGKFEVARMDRGQRQPPVSGWRMPQIGEPGICRETANRELGCCRTGGEVRATDGQVETLAAASSVQSGGQVETAAERPAS